MPLLEAFLALALTLLSLAMIATLIVEMIHRIAGMRSENLKMMLGELYERELRDRDPKEMIENLFSKSSKELNDRERKLKAGVVKLAKENGEELKKDESKPGELVEKLLKKNSDEMNEVESELKERVEAEPAMLKEDFINVLICNPLKKGEESGWLRRLLGRVLDLLGVRGATNRKNLASISPEDLFEKLAYTDVGKRIKAKAEEEIDEKVDLLARSYDEISVAATDLYRRRAQIVSLFVGVFVAFLFNADALSILKAYLNDPQARVKAVARADVVLENFTKMSAETRPSAEAMSGDKTPDGDETADSSKTPDGDETPDSSKTPEGDETPDSNEPSDSSKIPDGSGTSPTAGDEGGYKSYDEFIKDVNSIRDEIKELGEMGIPLGYSIDRPPLVWCVPDPSSEESEQGSKPEGADPASKASKQDSQADGANVDSEATKQAPKREGADPNSETAEEGSEPEKAYSLRKLLDREVLPDASKWAFCVFGTGLLIGLGGPFWFNVVRKLTDTLQVARGGTPTAAETGESATVPDDHMKSLRDTFKTANGLPPLAKAQAKLTAATKAAKDADKAVKAAIDVLIGTQDSAGQNPPEFLQTAIGQARDAVMMATDEQEKAHNLVTDAQEKVDELKKKANGLKEESVKAPASPPEAPTSPPSK